MVAILENFFQILIALFLGSLIGLEREYKRKEAGLRTFSLVSLGACLFVILAQLFQAKGSYPLIQLDLTRVIQAVAIGIGFLGGGLIIFRGEHIEGLTTAASLWATAGVGVAIGMKFYFLGFFSAFAIIGVLSGLRLIEAKIFKK